MVKACAIKVQKKGETSLLRQALKKTETLYKRKYLFAVIKNILGGWRVLVFVGVFLVVFLFNFILIFYLTFLVKFILLHESVSV